MPAAATFSNFTSNLLWNCWNSNLLWISLPISKLFLKCTGFLTAFLQLFQRHFWSVKVFLIWPPLLSFLCQYLNKKTLQPSSTTKKLMSYHAKVTWPLFDEHYRWLSLTNYQFFQSLIFLNEILAFDTRKICFHVSPMEALFDPFYNHN